MLVSIVLFTSASNTLAASFKDVSSFKEEIDYLTDAKIINGFSDGTYRPNNPILRVHAVMMIMRDLGVENVDPLDPGFVDLKPTDRGYLEVATAVELGIISGKDKTHFDPNGKLTRAEMSKILVLAYEMAGIYPKGFKDVSSRSWAYPYISALAANNVTVGYSDGTFKPSLTIDRGQFAAFLARILEPSFMPFSPSVANTKLEMATDVLVTDAIMHPTEPILYVIDGNDNTLGSINVETYEENYVELPYPAEKLAYANGKVYVTQVKKPHSSYTFDENQQGAFATFDAQTLEALGLIHIKLDPFDIVADDQGIVYISSGSGQHTRLESYNSQTGAILSSQRIYEKSYLNMTPNQKKIYAIDTSLSPRDITSYSIIDGKLESGIDSPYHGDYDLNTRLEITPDGRYLLNGLGGIFRASATSAADMTFVGPLDRPFTSAAFDLTYNELYTANKSNLITVYDYLTFEGIYQLTSYGNINYMFYNQNSNWLLALTTVKIGDSPKPLLGFEKVYFSPDESEQAIDAKSVPGTHTIQKNSDN
jgi:hypothetical protein